MTKSKVATKADLALETKRYRSIPNEPAPERPIGTLRLADQEMKKTFPRIELRSLSGTYNCVGHVFASRRTWVPGLRIAGLPPYLRRRLGPKSPNCWRRYSE